LFSIYKQYFETVVTNHGVENLHPVLIFHWRRKAVFDRVLPTMEEGPCHRTPIAYDAAQLTKANSRPSAVLLTNTGPKAGRQFRAFCVNTGTGGKKTAC